MGGRGHELSFTGSQGTDLAATLEVPAGEPRAYALFAHCFTCTKDYLAPVRVSRHLAEQGIAVLRFDFTGLGASCGEFADTSFGTNVADVVAAASFLRASYRPPALLIGHSLGGAAVLAAASRVPEVVAVATIAAPSRPAGLRQLLAPVAQEIRDQGSAEVLVGDRPVRIGRAFLDDLDRDGQRDAARAFRGALLVLHSPVDDVVPIEAAAEIFAAARHPRSFVSLDGADHLLSQRADARYAAAVIGAWVSRYLDGA